MCEDHKGDLNFPFQAIAEAMRMIDDVMVPVIVAKEEDNPGEVRALVRPLPFVRGVGGIARELQRYTVGVPRRVRSALIAEGAAEIIYPEKFEDQFVVLLNLDIYTAEAGLDWSDSTFMQAEALIQS